MCNGTGYVESAISAPATQSASHETVCGLVKSQVVHQQKRDENRVTVGIPCNTWNSLCHQNNPLYISTIDHWTMTSASPISTSVRRKYCIFSPHPPIYRATTPTRDAVEKDLCRTVELLPKFIALCPTKLIQTINESTSIVR